MTNKTDVKEIVRISLVRASMLIGKNASASASSQARQYIQDAIAALTALSEENARLRDALEPFSSPPAYVFENDAQYVPANMPKDWIGGGWFSTDDFKRARQATKGTQ